MDWVRLKKVVQFHRKVKIEIFFSEPYAGDKNDLNKILVMQQKNAPWLFNLSFIFNNEQFKLPFPDIEISIRALETHQSAKIFPGNYRLFLQNVSGRCNWNFFTSKLIDSLIDIL